MPRCLNTFKNRWSGARIYKSHGLDCQAGKYLLGYLVLSMRNETIQSIYLRCEMFGSLSCNFPRWSFHHMGRLDASAPLSLSPSLPLHLRMWLVLLAALAANLQIPRTMFWTSLNEVLVSCLGTISFNSHLFETLPQKNGHLSASRNSSTQHWVSCSRDKEDKISYG